MAGNFTALGRMSNFYHEHPVSGWPPANKHLSIMRGGAKIIAPHCADTCSTAKEQHSTYCCLQIIWQPPTTTPASAQLCVRTGCIVRPRACLCVHRVIFDCRHPSADGKHATTNHGRHHALSVSVDVCAPPCVCVCESVWGWCGICSHIIG